MLQKTAIKLMEIVSRKKKFVYTQKYISNVYAIQRKQK